MVRRLGLEPRTTGLKGRCSTIELAPRIHGTLNQKPARLQRLGPAAGKARPPRAPSTEGASLLGSGPRRAGDGTAPMP